MASAVTQLRDERRSRRKAVVEAGLITVEMNPVGFGLMLNISRAGMAVYTLNRLRPGDEVQIAFRPPKSEGRVEALATVTWVSNGNAGLHIQKIRRDSLDVMNNWLASLPELSSPTNGVAQRGRRPLFETQVRAIEIDIRVAGFGDNQALQLIAERVMPLTKASGTAIAVGEPENMICRGSAGLAPGIGTAISADSGLTGECIRTGKLIRCDDTESDSRVDRDACRELNLRSSMIAPVLFEGQVRGVLEVFSGKEKAFDEEHGQLLERLADLASQLVYGRPTPPEVPVAAASDRAPEKKTLVRPEESPVAEDNPLAGLEHLFSQPGPNFSADLDITAAEEPMPSLRRPWLAWAIIVLLLLSLLLCWRYVSSLSQEVRPHPKQQSRVLPVLQQDT